MRKTIMELMGFGDDHVPLVRVAKRQKHREIPVNVPLRKGARKSMRAANTLMRDAIIHFECNPEVVRISDFPMRLEYEVQDRYGAAGSLNHVPMLGVWTRQKQASYFDIIPRTKQADMPWLESRTNRLKRAVWEDYRATYRVLDETELHLQPRWMNYQTIRYHAWRADKESVMGVRRAMTTLPVVTDISAISVAAALPNRAHVFFNDDGTIAQYRELPEIKRAFSAVLWLANQGEITLDMSDVISFATKITRKSSLLANNEERVA
ncbi:hypothetical protein [Agrobacterium rosae]|uniref:hypothetical protein n=1 Tax=Agrobacterium rosae TaxID=1972867 RepID=UPI003A80F690